MSEPPRLIQIRRPAMHSLVENDLHVLGLSRRRHVRWKPKLQRKSHVSVRQIGRSNELVPRPPRQAADDRQNDDREGTGNSSCRRSDRNSRRRRARRLGGRRSRKRRAMGDQAKLHEQPDTDTEPDERTKGTDIEKGAHRDAAVAVWPG